MFLCSGGELLHRPSQKEKRIGHRLALHLFSAANGTASHPPARSAQHSFWSVTAVTRPWCRLYQNQILPKSAFGGMNGNTVVSSVCGRLAEIPVLGFGIPFSVGHTAVVFPWSTLYWIYSSLQPLWLCSLSAGAASVQWLQLL